MKSDPLAPKLSLQQLPSRRLRVQRCALEEGALTNAYRALAQHRLVSPCVMLGIFVDAPFHQDRASCRHYLALESERTDAAADAFELPGGLYASVSIAGDLDALSQAILRFKTDVLDPSPYAIGSTLAFERVLLPGTAADFDYRRSEREVFIKVRRKLEPVI